MYITEIYGFLHVCVVNFDCPFLTVTKRFATPLKAYEVSNGFRYTDKKVQV